MSTRLVYRAMFPDSDGLPLVGEERNQLGVRRQESAMSVFLDPRRIPPPIRPKAALDANGECGLNGETVLYSMSEDDFGEHHLRLGNVARSTHAPIEADPACDRAELLQRLAETKSKWSRVQ